MAHRIQFQDLISHLIDGDAVDWAAARSAAGSAEEAKTLQALEILARIRDASVRHPAGAGARLPFPRWRHLRLIDRIGQGQHGELYRAWDESLQLLVALKLLPDGAPPGTQAMLLNEARLLAQVRHDNVVRVHGADLDQGRVGYWMEFIDGETLDPAEFRSPSGAVWLGLDVARALAAIHAAGVVHGDVKPANILRTTTGRTCLVDFSVAQAPAGGDSARPWVSGTPYYMAPELLLHQPTSPRADVYSLGVLLFHLATGEFPFTAPDIDALRTAHAARGAGPIVMPAHNLPSPLIAFLNECLSADPSKRPTSASAVERLQQLAAALSAPTNTPVRQRSRLRTLLLLGSAALAFTAITALLSRTQTRPNSNEAPSGLALEVRRLTSSGYVGTAAISPDGMQVAYTESDEIHLVRLPAGPTTTLVPRSEYTAEAVAISPDGAWVYYLRRRPSNAVSTLCRVSVAGGAPEVLYRDIDGEPGFSPDASSLALWRMRQSDRFVTTELYLGSNDGRDSLRLLFSQEDAIIGSPHWSPDGKCVAWQVRHPAASNAIQLAILPVGGGEMRSIGSSYPLKTYGGFWWDSTGTGVYVVSRALHYIRLRDGAARRITSIMPNYGGFTASADGRHLVAVRSELHANLWRVPVGGHAAENSASAKRLTWVSGFTYSPDISRRGGALTFTSDASGSTHVCVLEKGSAQPRQVTQTPGLDRWARWSPDGTRIAFASTRGDSTHIFTIDADGTNERQLTHLMFCNYPEWTPDGRWIDFTEGEQVGYIRRVPAGGGPSVLLLGPGYAQPRWSPDGMRLLCTKVDDDVSYVTVVQADRLHNGPEPRLLRVTDTSGLAWHPDGRRFTALAPGSRENLANRSLDGKVEPPFTAFSDGLRMINWCWERDGSAIVCTRGGDVRDVMLFDAATENSLQNPPR